MNLPRKSLMSALYICSRPNKKKRTINNRKKLTRFFFLFTSSDIQLHRISHFSVFFQRERKRRKNHQTSCNRCEKHGTKNRWTAKKNRKNRKKMWGRKRQTDRKWERSDQKRCHDINHVSCHLTVAENVVPFYLFFSSPPPVVTLYIFFSYSAPLYCRTEKRKGLPLPKLRRASTERMTSREDKPWRHFDFFMSSKVW